MKRILIMLLSALMCLSLAACSGNNNSEPAKKEVTEEDYKNDNIELTYNEGIAEMTVGEQKPLNLAVVSENGYDYTIDSVTSEDEKIVTVEDGIVKTNGIGTTRIRVVISHKMPRMIDIAVKGDVAVSFYDEHEMFDLFNSMNIWRDIRPGDLEGKLVNRQEESYTTFMNRYYWADKGGKGDEWNQFVFSLHTDESWIDSFDADSESCFYMSDTGDILDIFVLKDTCARVEVTLGKKKAIYRFDGNGYLVKAAGQPWILEDTESFRAFLDKCNTYVSFAGLTVEDFFDTEAFLKAIEETQ